MKIQEYSKNYEPVMYEQSIVEVVNGQFCEIDRVEYEGHLIGIFTESSYEHGDMGNTYQYSHNYALVKNKKTGENVKIDLDRDHRKLRFL